MVTRYSPTEVDMFGDIFLDMEEDPEGEWVSLEDYNKVKEKLRVLEGNTHYNQTEA